MNNLDFVILIFKKVAVMIKQPCNHLLSIFNKITGSQ